MVARRGERARRLMGAGFGILAGMAGSIAAAQADPAPAQPAAPPKQVTPALIPPPLIPTAVLAEKAFIRSPVLSPDGSRVMGRFRVRGMEMLGIIALADGKVDLINVGEKHEVNWFRWAGNERVLISLGTTVPWGNDDAWSTRLIVRTVATKTDMFIGGKDEGLIGDDVLWIDPAGQHALLSYQASIYDYPSVWNVELANNHRKAVVAAHPGVWDWYADEAGVVRAGYELNDNSWRMLYRAKDGDAFKSVVKGRYDDDDAGFDAFRIYQGSDDGYRIMLDDKSGLYGLYHFNYATRTRGDLIFADPKVDIDDFSTKGDSNVLLSASYTDDHPRTHWFDTDLSDLQAAIEKSVPGREVEILSIDRDRDRMIVWLGASNDPGAYYTFDLSAGKLFLLGKVSETLKPEQLAATTYTSYKARDGVTIPAYLTVPAGREAKKLPLIVMPHGGPYDIRDDGTYDPDVQFFANRGYAVLQPEYRGSGGYGKAFYDKGAGQWGRVMQDDLDDGMDWLAAQGTIDPKRVCIIGSSYGGYAALWGATRNPERYRCAASFAGVSDLKKQLKYQLDFKISKRYQKDWRQKVQGSDTFDLTTVSPLYTIDRLKVPVLLMHGDADPRVPFKQSRLYADALKAAGKPYEFYPLKGEVHGFTTSANAQLWYDKLDAFLSRYNPAH